MEKTITYFEKPGIENTDALLKKDWKALILNM